MPSRLCHQGLGFSPGSFHEMVGGVFPVFIIGKTHYADTISCQLFISPALLKS